MAETIANIELRYQYKIPAARPSSSDSDRDRVLQVDPVLIETFVEAAPRTRAATPLRPDRLPMRCVQGLAISSGTLASASGCRPRSTSEPHRGDRTVTKLDGHGPLWTGISAWSETWYIADHEASRIPAFAAVLSIRTQYQRISPVSTSRARVELW